MKKLVIACLAVVLGAVGAFAQEPAPGKDGLQTFTYKKTKQTDLALEVHFPPGWKKTDKRPAIVFFFGGGWTHGSTKQFVPQAEHLAKRGWVAARADYRVKSRHDVSPMDCVADARGAIRWMRKNAAMLGVDPEKIVSAGGSAGGHLAACTALGDRLDAEDEDAVSSVPSALVLFNPVLRFEGVPDLIKRLDKDVQFARLLSPTLFLSKQTPPAILFYGSQDKLLAQGEEYVALAKKLGVRAELFVAEDVGHGFFNRPPWLEKTIGRMDQFLAALGY